MKFVVCKLMVTAVSLVLIGCNHDKETLPVDADQPQCTETSGESNDMSVTGTIDFDTSIVMEDIAWIQVELIDYSIADAGAITISSVCIYTASKIPVSYSVGYESENIVENNLYSITAEVYKVSENEDEPNFLSHRTMQSYPVLTNGFGSNANILVKDVN